jgi:prepilin-type N-terminal cleavage/methylation domain-containing protein
VTRRAQRGFTLVELMISLVLFSVAIAGILSVAVSMGQGMREQRAAVATESQVRVPMDFLTDAIRQAGPAVPTAATTVVNTNLQDVTTCDIGAVVVTNNTSGPDTLDLVYASGAVVTATMGSYVAGTTSLQVADASQLAVGDMILISNKTQGHTVTITGIDVPSNTLTLAGQTCATLALPTGGYPAFSIVVRVVRARFTIVPNTPGVAPADGIPVLMMDPDGPNGPALAEPLAEGVEDLQVALGVDVNGDGVIDPLTEWAFDTAGHGALVGPILSVRLVMVSRATTIAANGAKLYTPLPALDHAPAATADTFRRRVLEATVEIRNMGGSP